MPHSSLPSKLSPIQAVGPRGPWFRTVPISATDTPLLNVLQSRGQAVGDLLLETAVDDATRRDAVDSTKFSFLLTQPAVWHSTRATQISDWRNIQAEVVGFVQESLPPNFPPFAGGAAGLVAYDWCRALEQVPMPNRDDFQVPALTLGVYDRLLAVDHQRSLLYLIATGYPELDLNVRAARAREQLEQLATWIAAPTLGEGTEVLTGCRWSGYLDLSAYSPLSEQPASITQAHERELLTGTTREDYLHSLIKARDYLHAGDIFQVNLAQQLLVPLRHSPLELYQRMRRFNSAPFAGYFDLGNHHLISASPERLVRVRGREVETRPIKGTRRLSNGTTSGQASDVSLRASLKDCAENLMIVDLLRNDLSRVCSPESIRVRHLCRLEDYRHVQHLVSVIEGSLEPERTAWDLFLAVFPGGSITGAPKVRAMEIINELEPLARGAYCGSLGYIGFPNEYGEMNSDWNILIRTATLCGQWCQIPVGGGIVLGSQPAAEYTETLDKARGLLLAASPMLEEIA